MMLTRASLHPVNKIITDQAINLPSQRAVNRMKGVTSNSLKHHSFPSNNIELSKFWSAALRDCQIRSAEDPTWAEIIGWFAMGEMCEGWVPSKCYNSNWAQREAETKKRKEGEEAGNVRKNSLHVGGVNVAQSLARNIFLVPLYLSSESFNTKLHPEWEALMWLVTFDCDIHHNFSFELLYSRFEVKVWKKKISSSDNSVVAWTLHYNRRKKPDREQFRSAQKNIFVLHLSSFDQNRLWVVSLTKKQQRQVNGHWLIFSIA